MRGIACCLLLALLWQLCAGKERVEILLWSGGTWAGFGSGPELKAPNYLGHTVKKQECPIDCVYTGDRSRTGIADGIIFEAQPLASYGDEYLRKPIPFPQKRPGQYYINFGYEQKFYFPLYAEPFYLRLQDINMTFDQTGAVPITFTCSWGGGWSGDANIEDFLKPHFPRVPGKKIGFLASNCGGGGASFRTEYIKEMMKYTKVDALGQCMHNADLPTEYQQPVFADHGSSQRYKLQVFKDYKFVLAFENNNVTDYVTEKLPSAFMSTTLPIYMGAPNIDDWLPGENSVIRTDKFSGAKELSEYINYLDEHDEEYEKYFEWKKHPLRPQFVDKYNKCVFYNSECRLCTKIAEMRAARQNQAKELLARSYALSFDGSTSVEVSTDSLINAALTTEYTLGVWIYPARLQPMRIIDKNTAGKIDGFTFDLQPVGVHLFLRLCAATTCIMGQRPLSPNTWYYITVVFSQEGTEGVRFYINGKLDVSIAMFSTTAQNSLNIRFGYSAAGSADYFVGKMDDISIWGRALSEEEIIVSPWKRFAGDEIGLLGYYSFNEGSGDVLHDWSAGGRHGKVLGTVVWEDSDLKPLALNSCW